MKIFEGSGVALVTPFTPNNEVDFNKIKELVEYHIKNSTDAIIVTGTTGEASTMTDDEHLATIECVVNAVNKRIPVIAGTGSNDTRHGIALSQNAEKLGCDGLLIVTPYYNKGNRTGIINHYKTLADCVNIPIILYNVPGRTGVNLTPDIVLELSKVENIVGLKEASNNFSQITAIANQLPEDFAIYSGNDDTIVPLLSLGGSGVISVLANVCPQETHDLVQKFLDGDVAGSRKIQLELLDFVDALFYEVNPVPVKTAMNMLGFNVGKLRLPLAEMDPAKAEKLADVMKKANILK